MLQRICVEQNREQMHTRLVLYNFNQNVNIYHSWLHVPIPAKTLYLCIECLCLYIVCPITHQTVQTNWIPYDLKHLFIFYDKYCLIHVEYFYVQSMEKRKLINLDVCRQCKQQFVLIFSIPDLKIRDLNCFFNVSINFHGLRENHSFPNLFYLFTLT